MFDQYKSGYFCPSDEIDPAKKDKEWGRKVCEYFYSVYLNDQAGLPYSRRQDYVIARLYAEGKQPTQKYQEWSKKAFSRKGWQNISHDIFPIMPKFEAIFLGMFDKMEHDISVTATDDNAKTEKQNKKSELKAKLLLNDYFNKIGLPSSPSEDIPVEPRTVRDIEIFMELTYKLKKEILLEKWLKDGFFDYCNWRETKKMLLKDLFRLGVGACRDYVHGDKIKARYVDPANLLIAYSNKNTFDNVDKVAEIVPYRITQLRPLLLREGYKEDDIAKIVQPYLGLLGNPSFIDMNVYYYNQVPYYQYDDFKILVMETEWDSNNIYKSETKITKKGDKFSKDVAYDYKLSKSREEKGYSVDNTDINVIYQNKWVIGTEMCFDFGLMKDAPRESSGKDKYLDIPKKSFHVYKWSDNSMVMRCISALDEIQMDIMKLRNAKAKAAVKGVAWDLSVIDNVTIGGKRVDPFDVMAIRRESGDLVYRATTHHSQVLSPTASRPVTELEGGIGIQLQEWITSIDYNINFIRQVIGINEVTDGTNTNPRQAVGVSNLLNESTNNALQPVYGAYVYLKQEIAKNAVNRLILKGDFDAYYDILGDFGEEVLKSLKGSQYFIKFILKPQEYEKQYLYDLVARLSQVPLEQGGISGSNAFAIRQLIAEGRLKLAEAMLAYYEDKNKSDALKLQQENIQLQQQAAQQTEMAKAQAQGQIDQQNIEGQKIIEDTKGGWAMELAKFNHMANMEQIRLEQSMGGMTKERVAEKQHESAVLKSDTEITKEVIKSNKPKTAA